ncbi:MAG: exopolysaccharide biosynthesis polyprenyl glycosylphosphotransferase [Actinomycetota bacterium]|nr:exopolysaccharide biosynthesis polyprenyl glycosylphosphotransferase [Actinomycetota bacterium]
METANRDGASAAPASPRPFRAGSAGRVGSPLETPPALDQRTERQIREGRSSESTQRRDTAYRRLLGLADVASATIAVLVGVPILGHDSLDPLALLALPLVLTVSKITGLYDRDEHLLRKTTLDEVPALFWVATLYAFLIFLAGDKIVEGHFGRDQAVGVWALLFASMLATRTLARCVARVISAEERCLVLGDAETTRWVSRRLEQAPSLKARVVGRLPLEPELPSPNGDPAHGSNGDPAHGDAVALTPDLAEEIDRAIIAPRGAVSDDLLVVIRRVKSFGVKVSVLPRLFEVVGSSIEVDNVDGITLLGMRRYGLTRSSQILKRCFDLGVAGVGLLLLAPLLGMIAVAIKLESRGPVLFRQRRMGRDDLPFEILKFRTMVDGADAQRSALADRNEAGGGLFTISDDSRLTRVGRVLRRTSLDELPQLVNVLRGEMALVGPRPLVLDEDSRIEGWQRWRLQLPPGVTGLWQVCGSARIPMQEMVKMDYLYCANWSLWLDVKILARTISFVLGRRGL